MKKLLGLGIVLVSCLALVACGSGDDTTVSSSVSSTPSSAVSSSTVAESSTQEATTTESSSSAANEGKEYTTEEAETALNAGEDLTGAIVTITVDEFEPASAFGYNIMTGEHLNFVSSENPNVNIGDTLKVKVVKITSTLGSFIITYEK